MTFKIDPTSQYAVGLIYGFQLVVIPLILERSDDDDNKIEEEGEENDDEIQQQNDIEIGEVINPENKKRRKTKRSLIKIIDLSEELLLPGIVLDYTFLYGFDYPTLVLLQQLKPAATSCGLIGIDDNSTSCKITAIQIMNSLLKIPKIFSFDKLPYNCSSLYPLPPPCNGLLLFSPSLIIYCHFSQFYILSLNGYSDLVVDKERYVIHNNPEKLNISLYGEVALYLRSNLVLLGTGTGDVL